MAIMDADERDGGWAFIRSALQTWISYDNF